MKYDFSSCNPKGSAGQYISIIRDNLKNNDAKDFLLKHGIYCELFDDCIDKDKDIDRLHQLSILSIEVFNHPYYIKFRESLLITTLIENITYFDAVAWEQSNVEWKRRDARVLSHCNLSMFLAVLIIEIGVSEAKLVSNLIRERLHAYSLFDKDNAYYGKKHNLNLTPND